ncbi:MAG: hypothetical protein GY926_20940 [bacterium]|nr:hypothetical protein [bacterium]MCP4967686.1 hypothetical protein [bacterium]
MRSGKGVDLDFGDFVINGLIGSEEHDVLVKRPEPARGERPASPGVIVKLTNVPHAVLTFDGQRYAGNVTLTQEGGLTSLFGNFEDRLTVVVDTATTERGAAVAHLSRNVLDDEVFTAVVPDDEPQLEFGVEPDPADREFDIGIETESERYLTQAGTNSSNIDVLFVYTPEALSNAGHISTMRSRLRAQLAVGNDALNNSGINAQFHELDFLATHSAGNNTLTILTQLWDPNDSAFDDVPVWRDIYGADVVVLVDQGPSVDACGRAPVPSSTSFRNYNNTQGYLFAQAASYTGGCYGDYVLPHELGHILGAGHNTTDRGYYTDSAGYTRTGSNGFRTLVNDATTARPRIPYYSTQNPAVPYQPGSSEFIVGNDARENDRALDRFDGLIARSRYSDNDIIDTASVHGSSSRYYRVSSSGRVTAVGGAPFLGDTRNLSLNAPIVGIETDRDGYGYWLVASDGGVFGYGASFHGSAGNLNLVEPIVDMITDPDGSGYWLIAADGGVFSYAAQFHGSLGNINLAAPIVAGEARAGSSGYYMLGRDGGVFAFNAPFHGSSSSGTNSKHQPAVDIVTVPGGYAIISAFGWVRSYPASAESYAWWNKNSSTDHGDLVTGVDGYGSSIRMVDRTGTIAARS